MANVSPPTSRLRLTDDQGYITRQGVQFLQDLVNRTGGVGDVTLLASLSAGFSTDNAVTRFDGTGGDKLQSSQVTVDDGGNVGVPGGSTVDGRDVSADGGKLDGIEAGATADQTALEIKASYESNADTNAFTDSEQTKLGSIEAGADVNDVDSVFGRTGAISAQAGDYDTDQITEASNLYFTDERVDDRVNALLVGGTNVTTTYDDGANTLTIDAASAPVDSVFGRTSTVVAQAGDYNASQVDNDSSVSGSFVSDALDTLDTNKLAQSSGSWTPVLVGSNTAGSNSYSTQTGNYIRIGNLVYVWFRVKLDGTSGALNSAGNMRIQGLPFTPNDALSSGIAGNSGDLSLTNDAHLGFWLFNSEEIVLIEATSSGNQQVSDAELTDNTDIRGSVWYKV